MMTFLKKFKRGKWLCLMAAILLPLFAYAHLMSPQRGTINFTNGGGYVALSLPVSAFAYVDDNGKHVLSMEGYVKYQHQMLIDITKQVQLCDEQGALPLEGAFLNFTPPDDDPKASISQILLLGRYTLRHSNDENTQKLRFKINLFGVNADEQKFNIAVTRVNAKTGQKERQLLEFSPEHSDRGLFASAWDIFKDYVRLGVEHILTGWDHLLFLLVVLAAARGWRQVLMTLTCFTIGHAMTLTLSLVGGVNVAPNIVEPTIALTIVGMAFFDMRMSKRNQVMPTFARLGLVFLCALIHGLGLASSLTELGLDKDHLVESLIGFNLGIELGQLAVSVIIGLIVAAILKISSAQVLQKMRIWAGYAAMIIGSYWFVERVLTM